MATSNANELTRLRSSCVLIFAMFCCGCISLYYGKDLEWDLANYHFSNPYQLLHQRWLVDYWPGSYIHGSFSPTADLVSYFLINNFHPALTVFLSGALHGVCAWLLFLITYTFLPQSKHRFLISLVITIIGIYAPLGFSSIGNFKADHTVSIFVLSYIFIQTKLLKMQKFPPASVLLSGLLLGIGMGLKLTVGIFVAGGAIALFCLPLALAEKMKMIFYWGIGIGLGVITSMGYWMLILWHLHHNPIFPFFNYIFHSPDFSPDFAAANPRDLKIIPHGFWQTLFFPFYFVLHSLSEGQFFNFRFPIVYTLFVCLGVRKLWQYCYAKNNSKLSLPVVWLFCFVIFSYGICQEYFACLRYILPLEMLAPLVIFLLVINLTDKPQWQLYLSIYLFGVLLLTVIPNEIRRDNNYNVDYFDLHLPSFVSKVPEAMVLIAYPAYARDLEPRPLAYLIPLLPAKWRFTGIPFLNNTFDSSDAKAMRIIRERVANYNGNIYLLTTEFMMPKLAAAMKTFGVKQLGKCENIYSARQSVSLTTALICPAMINK